MILLKPVHYEKIAPCSMPPWACLLCSSVLRGETKSSQSQRSLVWPVLQFCTSLRSLNPWINPWMNPWMIRRCRIALKWILDICWNVTEILEWHMGNNRLFLVWAVLSPKQNGHRKLPRAPKWDQQGLALRCRNWIKLGWCFCGSDRKKTFSSLSTWYITLWYINIDPGSCRGSKTSFH